MSDLTGFTLRPPLLVSETDHHQLTVLALAGTGHSSDEAEDLLFELERAQVVPEVGLPSDAVRMGSSARYRTASGDERRVTLVYPADADISLGKISVLTPVGTALIGLRGGQSITWLARDGRKLVLTVLDVMQPDESGDDDPGPVAA